MGIIAAFVINLTTIDNLFIFKPVSASIKQPIIQEIATQDNLIQQGRESYQQGKFQEALIFWQQALETFETQEDSLHQAMVLAYISLAYQQLGMWPQADNTLSQSLSLWKYSQVTAKNPEQSLILAQILNSQGNFYFSQGKTENALESWQQASKIYNNTNEVSKIIGSLINVAQAQQALGFYHQARNTLTQVEQRLETESDLKIKNIGLISLGKILQKIGDIENSQRILEESLIIAKTLNSSQSISEILLALGNNSRTEKQYSQALDFYQQAEKNAINPLTKVQAQLNQFSLLIEAKKIKDAQILIPQIQLEINQLTSNRRTIYAQINFAQSLSRFWQLNQQDTTLPLTLANILKNAHQQAQTLQDIHSQAYALGYLGQIYEKNLQFAQAEKLTQQALSLTEKIAAPEIAYQWQWQLGRIAKAQGKLALAKENYQAAFKNLKSIRQDLVVVNSDIQFSFRESVEPIYRELVDILLQSEKGKNIEQNQLKQAREVIESLKLAELNNFFHSTCLEGQTVSLDRITDNNAAIIYPIILPDRLEIIVSLSQQELRRYTTQVSQLEIETTVEKLRFNLEKPYSTPEGKQLSQQVYQWLIAPVSENLQKNKVTTLVFILDGALQTIPMASLYDGEQYLLENYAISLAPSLQLINPQPLKQKVLNTLAAGISEARLGFSSLENVNQELSTIKAELPSKILVNQDFTTTSLQQQIESFPYTIIHLATHGQFSSNADETFILAWDQKILVSQLDNLIRSNTNLGSENIELLVLSACETAAGDKRATLGLAGIALQAGARSTLASLWSLDDESGAYLMREFYRELSKENISKAEALRQAQLKLLKDPDYRHPVYWASYILMGNWL